MNSQEAYHLGNLMGRTTGFLMLLKRVANLSNTLPSELLKSWYLEAEDMQTAAMREAKQYGMILDDEVKNETL